MSLHCRPRKRTFVSASGISAKGHSGLCRASAQTLFCRRISVSANSRWCTGRDTRSPPLNLDHDRRCMPHSPSQDPKGLSGMASPDFFLPLTWPQMIWYCSICSWPTLCLRIQQRPGPCNHYICFFGRGSMGLSRVAGLDLRRNGILQFSVGLAADWRVAGSGLFGATRNPLKIQCWAGHLAQFSGSRLSLQRNS